MQAHTSAIRCLSAHSSEDVFVSGAADGDVKVEKGGLDLNGWKEWWVDKRMGGFVGWKGWWMD